MKAIVALSALCLATAVEAGEIPKFQVDAAWPKPLPNDWIMGQAAGVAVDAQDHIWVVQRPKTLTDDEKAATFNPPRTKCCKPAPPVLEFDAEGNLVQAWGGPGQGYDWPQNEHGIHIDHKGFVWLAANGEQDGHILKFTRDGKFVLQIGKPGPQTNSTDTTRLGRPAHMVVDPATNEVYVADGYYNHRVIVFDADTGAYKRHWGAYGKPPTDDKLPPYNPSAAPAQQFSNPVHCVRIAQDGLVYVCDRANDRIQVFRKDGSFVKEFFVEKNDARQRLDLGPGALPRPGRDLHHERRRREQRGQDARARHRRGGRRLRPQRPPGGRLPLGAQHRHRFEGDDLHDRGRHREAGAEIRASRRHGAEEADAAIEHDPEKWLPVFGKDHAQTNR